MSAVARRRDVFSCAAALAGGLLLIRLVACDPIDGGTTDVGGEPGVSRGTGSTIVGGRAADFTIDGDAAEPLSPGAMAPLDLAMTNPHDFPMSVRDLSVSVLEVAAPNADRAHPCGVRDFAVEQVPDSVVLTIAAGETSTFSSLGLPPSSWPRLGLINRSVDQDGCKGAFLTLRYASSGTPAP